MKILRLCIDSEFAVWIGWLASGLSACTNYCICYDSTTGSMAFKDGLYYSCLEKVYHSIHIMRNEKASNRLILVYVH
jgi:hypothetical protein